MAASSPPIALGKPLGAASLDVAGKLPAAQLPSAASILSLVEPTNLNLSASPSGTNRISSYADLGKIVTGREYLGAWFKFWRSAATYASSPNVVLSGDSTTAGTGVADQNYIPNNLLTILARHKGLVITAVNGGQSGKATSDWLSTYLPADIAAYTGANIPPLYIARWGMNDPYPSYGLTPAQTVANIRAGLALLRAHWTADQTSIVVMMPNTASDDTNSRNELWREKVSAGIEQACRDYGAVFFDTYALLREARYGLTTGWLDVNLVHPSEDFNAMIYGALSEVICPPGLSAMIGKTTLVAPAAGFSLPANSENMATTMYGAHVSGSGYLMAQGLPIATRTLIATVTTLHVPTKGVWGIQLAAWDGTTWAFPHGEVDFIGGVYLQEAITLNAVRVYFGPSSWER